MNSPCERATARPGGGRPRRKRGWVGEGRSRDDVRPFFALLGGEGCKRLQAVVMDMNTAYEEEVRAHVPRGPCL